jgi:hypothetical protein
MFAIAQQQRIAVRTLQSMTAPARVLRSFAQSLSNLLSRPLIVQIPVIDSQLTRFTQRDLDGSKRGYEPTFQHPRISESTL